MTDGSWGIIFILGLATVIAAVLIVIIWQIFKTAQNAITSEALVNQHADFRNVAEDAATAQREAATHLDRLAEDMAETRARLTEIERMLREVG